jgi:hypothetical protein
VGAQFAATANAPHGEECFADAVCVENRVGVFSTLTNSYALVAVGASENFYSVFEAELQDVIPICHATIAGTRIIGRLTAGYVVLVPPMGRSCFSERELCNSLWGELELLVGNLRLMKSVQKPKWSFGTYEHDRSGATTFEK